MKYTIALFSRNNQEVFDRGEFEIKENLFTMKSRDASEFCRRYMCAPIDGVETYVISAGGKSRKLKYRG